MAVKPTINTVWASNSANRSDFTEDVKATGIAYRGPVVSNQLNGVMYETQNNLDALQRGGTAWNANKKYAKGDQVCISVIFNSVVYRMNLQSLADDNMAQPLSNSDINYDFGVSTFTITGTAL